MTDPREGEPTPNEATVGECLTLGGHDGSPCSKCGWTRPARPPAIPDAALARERAKHPHRSSHFRSWTPARRIDDDPPAEVEHHD